MTSTAPKITFSLDPELREAFNAASRSVGRSAQSVLRELVTAFVQRQHASQIELEGSASSSVLHVASPIAYASHELRNPLNALFGVLDTLSETPLTDAQAQYVQVASSTAHTMRSLIDRFLDGERAEAAAQSLLHEVFNLRLLLDDVKQHYVHVAASCGVDLSYDVDTTVPEQAYGDALRLRQVVSNLLGNAFKFTKQGAVSVAVRVQERRDGGSALSVQVRDTGIGMSIKQRLHAFTPYVQGVPMIPHRYGGSGLGLSVCRQIVTLMGGEIELESAPDSGTCVAFWVPLIQVPENPEHFEIAGPSPTEHRSDYTEGPSMQSVPVDLDRGSEQPFRVLVVEDNQTNRMISTSMLAMFQCVAEGVADGNAALVANSNGEFDLILMDCGLPDMDGYETTARIRAQDAQRGRRTVIVAVTGNTEAGAAEKCIAAGMDDYLAKPVTLLGVRRVLDKWLHGHGTKQPADLASLNRETFNKLREILGAALPHALVPFLEDSPVYLDELEAAVRDDNHAVAEARAHVLKGTSWNLGAEYLSALCAEAEKQAKTGVLEPIEGMLERMRAAYSEVESIFQTECADVDAIQAGLRKGEGKKRVLIVDDEPWCRRMMRRALERGDFVVDEAVDGADALDVLKRVRPDVILMDAIMPSLDGFMACQLITQCDEHASIPVVLVSGLDDKESMKLAFKAGASDFFTKPIDYATVAAQVRRLLM